MDILTLGQIKKLESDVDATANALGHLIVTRLDEQDAKVDGQMLIAAELAGTSSGEVTTLSAMVTQSLSDMNTTLGGQITTIDTDTTASLAAMTTTVSDCMTCITQDVDAAIAGVSTGCAGDFLIKNTNHWSVTNGGCHLNWTVPTGVQSITFTVVGGGGPGASPGHDHDVPRGGWGGNTSVKTLYASSGHFTAGSTSYSLCAGGTSQCSCCAHCQPCRTGCTSYVNGSNLSNFCATGGEGGATAWDKMSSCYDCSIDAQCLTGHLISGGWGSCQSCTPGYYGGDYGFTGTDGGLKVQYSCCNEQSSYRGSPTGPYTAPAGAHDSNYCTTTGMGCCRGHAMFPGGGGPAGWSWGSGCWGGFGAGGLVHVKYA